MKKSHGIYSVIDIALGHAEVPFFCRNDNVAKNAITKTFSNASLDSVLRISPEMYVLRRVGDFDCVTCVGEFYKDPITVLRFDEIILEKKDER